MWQIYQPTMYHWYQLDEERDARDEERAMIALATAISLNDHDHGANAQQAEALFSCDMCDRRFRSQVATNEHMDANVHWRERFECLTCDRVFGSQRATGRHMDAIDHWRGRFAPEDCDYMYDIESD